ncbi:MAG TPA: ABC transporter substrate-binding protein [Terriglobales bacterium]|nr:ABC transporter substrate-binding protein [Terriglobales bacterium]
MTRFRNLGSSLVVSTGILLAFLGVRAVASSAPGINDNEIKLGSCSALDGPARQLGLQTVLGATAYLDYVNEHGGVNGRKIHLISFDDGYDPDRAATCFDSLKREGVFAGGFFVGTPTASRYLPLAETEKMPIVGLFTGAQFLYEPVKHYVLNLRASYNDETGEQVDNLWKIGMRRIGVIYQDDAFGKAVLEGVKLALSKHGSVPVATGLFVRNTLNVSEGIASVRAGKAEAVILASPYAPAAEILKQAHANNWQPQFLTVSFVGTEALINAAGRDAEGMIITQVVPPYDRTDLPAVKLYRDSLAKYMSSTPPSFVSLEAFVNAMVIEKGLSKAGANPTREHFIEALETLHDFDIGLGSSANLQFTAHHHQGLGHVYPTVVHAGKPEVIEDWATLVSRK